MMRYVESIDEVSMVEEQFVNDTVEYDESEFMDYDINNTQSPLEDWVDFT